MAKVKFVGDTRRTVHWTSMGKAKSYSASPGRTITVPDTEVPYLLSFGCFEAVLEERHTTAEKTEVHTFERTRTNPIIKEIKVFENKNKETIINDLTKKVEPEEEKKLEVAVDPIAEVESVVKEEVKVEEPVESIVEEPKVIKVKKNIDYTKLKKSELKKICEKNGLDINGHRDDLIARCVDWEKKN
jgi:hypothetical protein